MISRILGFLITLAIITFAAFQAASMTLDYGVVSIAALAIMAFSVLFFLSPTKSVLFLILIRPVIDLFWDKPLLLFKNPLVMLGGLIILLMAVFLLTRRINIGEIPYSSVVLLFMGTQLLAFLFTLLLRGDSRFVYQALVELMKNITGFMFFLVTPFLFRDRREINLLINVLLISTAIPLLLSLYFLIQGGPGIFADFMVGSDELARGVILQFRGLSRLSGLYQGTMNVSFYCLVVIYLGTLKLSVMKNHPQKILLIGYMILSGYLLFSTYQRTAWIMAVAGLGIWFIFQKKRLYLVLLVIFGSLVIFYSESVRFRFADEVAFVTGEEDFGQIGSGRGTQWTKYMEIYTDDYTIPEKLFGRMGAIGRPENQFLYLLVSSGLLGLLSYLAMVSGVAFGLLSAFRRSTDEMTKNLLLLALVLHLVFIIAGFGGVSLHWVNTQMVVWSLVGVLLYRTRQEKLPMMTPAVESI